MRKVSSLFEAHCMLWDTIMGCPQDYLEIFIMDFLVIGIAIAVGVLFWDTKACRTAHRVAKAAARAMERNLAAMIGILLIVAATLLQPVVRDTAKTVKKTVKLAFRRVSYFVTLIKKEVYHDKDR